MSSKQVNALNPTLYLSCRIPLLKLAFLGYFWASGNVAVWMDPSKYWYLGGVGSNADP